MTDDKSTKPADESPEEEPTKAPEAPPNPEPPKELTVYPIPTDLGNALTAYLGKQPYQEVFGLIAGLQQAYQAELAKQKK